MAFDFIILFDSNSSPNNVPEILFTSIMLVDRLICLNISLIFLKTSKLFLSESILINLQLSFCSIAFCLFISYSAFLSLCPFSSSFIASL